MPVMAQANSPMTAAAPAEGGPPITAQQASRYAGWLRAAYDAAGAYNGTEAAMNAVIGSLNAMDDFTRAAAPDHGYHPALEEAFARAALNGEAQDVPLTISAMLEFAQRTLDEGLYRAAPGVLPEILKSGALVIETGHVFVQTDEGAIYPPEGGGKTFALRFQPRLAKLVQHLQDIGIYTDDLIIRTGILRDGMVRQKPYAIVQIPRLNREIAVCDQVGEITFVARGILDPLVWAHLSKDQLKSRPDIAPVPFEHGDEEKWWAAIRAVLLSDDNAPLPKIDVARYARHKPPLDIDLIRACIRAHNEGTKTPDCPEGEWPTQYSGLVAYGPYAGTGLTWRAINLALHRRQRGLERQLPVSEKPLSLAMLVAAESGRTYKNVLAQDDLDLEKIKECIRAHHAETGAWPTQYSGLVAYGPYAGTGLTWVAINHALRQRLRGLEGQLPVSDKPFTLAMLVAAESGRTYKNILAQDDLDLGKIRECIRAHHAETGGWPTQHSGVVAYGPYAGTGLTWVAINGALRQRQRGLDRQLPVSDKPFSLAMLKDIVRAEMAAEMAPHNDEPSDAPAPE